MKHINIAIDGPSGAGKSTVARLLAQELRFIYVDTGAMYRAVGLYVARAGIDAHDRGRIIGCLPEISIALRYEDGVQQIFLNGENVSCAIRTEEASRYASGVSAIPEVRAFLLGAQRSLAQGQNVIMDGRDIGTVVLPQADVKIFLTASSEKRAQRRYAELLAKGEPVVYDEVLRNLNERDKNDSSRQAAPLCAADDAVLVDTTEYTLEQSVSAIRDVIKEKTGYVV